jgi:hypothetical protein
VGWFDRGALRAVAIDAAPVARAVAPAGSAWA